jgi:hypothetical protein
VLLASAVSTSEAEIVAVVTGFAGIIAACGGVLLAIRAVRSKERRNAAKEYEQLVGQLDEARAAQLSAERWAHELAVLLARNGIDVPGQVRREPYRPGGHGVPDPADSVSDLRGAAGHLRRVHGDRRGRGPDDDDGDRTGGT